MFSDPSIGDFESGTMTFQLCATNTITFAVECSDTFKLDYTFTVTETIVCSDQTPSVKIAGTSCSSIHSDTILNLQSGFDQTFSWPDAFSFDDPTVADGCTIDQYRVTITDIKKDQVSIRNYV